MSPLAVGVLVALALVLRGGGQERRLAAVQPPRRVAASARPAPARRAAHRVVAAAAGVAAALAIGGGTGLLLGCATAAASYVVLARSDGTAARSRRTQLQRELPLACDLLAACIAAGVPPAAALDEVSRAVAGPLGDVLGGVGRGMRLGLGADAAWAPYLVDAPPSLRTLASVLARSADSGSSPTRTFDALATDLRERRRLDGEAAARRAGVLMVAPLGLCFLPAFVALGVVPLVVGLLRGGLAFTQ